MFNTIQQYTELRQAQFSMLDGYSLSDASVQKEAQEWVDEVYPPCGDFASTLTGCIAPDKQPWAY
eukprot:763563-Hanusia_phi.AAC.2